MERHLTVIVRRAEKLITTQLERTEKYIYFFKVGYYFDFKNNHCV